MSKSTTSSAPPAIPSSVALPSSSLSSNSSSPSSSSSIRPAIANFESNVPNRRVSFHDLLNGSTGITLTNASEIQNEIDSNPILDKLNKAGLLFFSTQYRSDVEKEFLNKPRHKAEYAQCKDDQDLGGIVLNSVKCFNEKYFDNKQLSYCSPLGQDFLSISASLLANTHSSSVSLLSSSSSLPSTVGKRSFQGLSIEAIPCYEGAVRSEQYNYASKQIQVCFRDLPGRLNTPHDTTLLLAHEFTHAIDDMHNQMNSVRTLFAKLNNVPGSFNAKKRDKQLEIAKCASQLVDDAVGGTFERQYLQNLTGMLAQSAKVKGKKQWKPIDVVDSICIASATNGIDAIQDQNHGTLYYGSVPAEFLTFSIEHVFHALSKSTDAQNFKTNYEQKVNSLLVNIAHYPIDVQVAALELVKDTTKVHLDTISLHTSSNDLKQCYTYANEVLQTRHQRLATVASQSLAVSSSSSSVSSVLSSPTPFASSTSSLSSTTSSTSSSTPFVAITSTSSTVQTSPALALPVASSVLTSLSSSSVSSSSSSSTVAPKKRKSVVLSSSSTYTPRISSSVDNLLEDNQGLQTINSPELNNHCSAINTRTPNNTHPIVRRSTSSDDIFRTVFVAAQLHSKSHSQTTSLNSVVGALPLNSSSNASVLTPSLPTNSVSSSKGNSKGRRNSF